MEHAARSRTIDIPAIMRALHQTLDDDPKILNDPIAPRLIDVDDDQRWLAPLLDHPFAKQWRAGFALRARYAEDCLAGGAQRGTRQYVILGAGLDSFAYRQPPWARSLQIYEVDHPITQQWKRDRLTTADIPTPSNLTFVPIDFENASIPEALQSSGFALGSQTICSWMGVTQYLTPGALEAVFRFVLSLPLSSEIVFSFIIPQQEVSGIEAEALAIAARRAEEVGEPWLSRLRADELALKLRTLGFSRIIHLTPAEAAMRYFRDRKDGLKERRGEQLMRAIV
ncbi:MAG TPA: class I SAM-dependent methyltransferase [Candidatus Binataceae bacterium]|nr:class I SAM-dependent methyltransferase [Candidatus Binataceae bacterium]